MPEQIRSWFRENQTLMMFLGAQLLAFGAAGVSIVAYYVKMENRVMTLETRGAEYSVARMNRTDERITVIEQRQARNEQQITRIVDILTRDIGKPP